VPRIVEIKTYETFLKQSEIEELLINDLRQTSSAYGNNVDVDKHTLYANDKNLSENN